MRQRKGTERFPKPPSQSRRRSIGRFLAGFLACGSTYMPPFPLAVPNSGVAAFVPTHSGASAAVFHRFPYYPDLRAPKIIISFSRTKRNVEKSQTALDRFQHMHRCPPPEIRLPLDKTEKLDEKKTHKVPIRLNRESRENRERSRRCHPALSEREPLQQNHATAT